jgi:hypothetical protein
MSFQEFSPVEAIEDSWLPDYRLTRNALWQQLVRLNSGMCILERIEGFPRSLFLSTPGERCLWCLVESALVEMCVMAIWRVCVGEKGDGQVAHPTIQGFRDEIVEHVRAGTYADQLRDRLRELKFDRAIAVLVPRIEEIRANYAAHLDLEQDLLPGDDVEQKALLLSELKSYASSLNSFFNALCFGYGEALLPVEHLPWFRFLSRTDHENCIERMLNGIARNSAILNLPERDAQMWAGCRENLSEAELSTLNRYRVRLGLTKA